MRVLFWAASLALLALCGCATPGAPAGTKEAAVHNRAPVKPLFTRADLLGRGASDLDNLLGPAALVRKEGRGEFRRYAFADCMLIIILYPDDSGSPIADHLDAAAKETGADKPDLDACLAKGPPSAS